MSVRTDINHLDLHGHMSSTLYNAAGCDTGKTVSVLLVHVTAHDLNSFGPISDTTPEAHLSEKTHRASLAKKRAPVFMQFSDSRVLRTTITTVS